MSRQARRCPMKPAPAAKGLGLRFQKHAACQCNLQHKTTFSEGRSGIGAMSTSSKSATSPRSTFLTVVLLRLDLIGAILQGLCLATWSLTSRHFGRRRARQRPFGHVRNQQPEIKAGNQAESGDEKSAHGHASHRDGLLTLMVRGTEPHPRRLQKNVLRVGSSAAPQVQH